MSIPWKSYVMAPLGRITDWEAFRAQLLTLRKQGVEGITTDLWWGEIEAKGEGQLDWDYHERYASVVSELGLRWAPILSFHACGMNHGDDHEVQLPSWVWSLGTAGELKFIDELGVENDEYLAFWFDHAVSHYDRVMASFAERFSRFAGIIDHIYVGLGPCGELRYPSYDSRAGWKYPQRGRLQAYSASARADFRRHVHEQYRGNLAALNRSWSTRLVSFDDVAPPADSDTFFAAPSSPYGRDFLRWYQGSLEKHMMRVVERAHARLDPVFAGRLGVKIAGVHWQHNNPLTPRAAAHAAGYHDYASLMDHARYCDVDLTFTCLEMDDSDSHRWPLFSAPHTLLCEVAALARQHGVHLSGENALALHGDSAKYGRIAQVMREHGMRRFTLLGMASIVAPCGTPTHEMSCFRQALLPPQRIASAAERAGPAIGIRAPTGA